LRDRRGTRRLSAGEFDDVDILGGSGTEGAHTDGGITLVDDVLAVGRDRRAGGIVDEDRWGPIGQIGTDNERRRTDDDRIGTHRLEHHEPPVG